METSNNARRAAGNRTPTISAGHSSAQQRPAGPNADAALPAVQGQTTKDRPPATMPQASLAMAQAGPLNARSPGPVAANQQYQADDSSSEDSAPLNATEQTSSQPTLLPRLPSYSVSIDRYGDQVREFLTFYEDGTPARDGLLQSKPVRFYLEDDNQRHRHGAAQFDARRAQYFVELKPPSGF